MVLEYCRDTQGAPQFHGKINHLIIFRNHFRTARHAPQMMSCITVVSLNENGKGVTYHMAIGWKHFREGRPVICVVGHTL